MSIRSTLNAKLRQQRFGVSLGKSRVACVYVHTRFAYGAHGAVEVEQSEVRSSEVFPIIISNVIASVIYNVICNEHVTCNTKVTCNAMRRAARM